MWVNSCSFFIVAEGCMVALMKKLRLEKHGDLCLNGMHFVSRYASFLPSPSFSSFLR